MANRLTQNDDTVRATQGILFDARFLESFAGQNILHDHKTAIMELIANAWDAGATRVDITWPDGANGGQFSVSDNGTGMTKDEFSTRWRTLSYNRLASQGPDAEFPADVDVRRRPAFGRNGIGRFAGFCFGSHYLVDTWRDGQCYTFRVFRDDNTPIGVELRATSAVEKHGTKVYVLEPFHVPLSPVQARAEIGMRFLTDPDFMVHLNAQRIDFSDIHQRHLRSEELQLDGEHQVTVTVIDTHATDRTTKQHGVAWHVCGRLVGDCSWEGTHRQSLLDGRTMAAKRYTFIVRADCLLDAVEKDWSAFVPDDALFQRTSDLVYARIRTFLDAASDDDRKATLRKAVERSSPELSRMSARSVIKWKSFVTQVQQECPSIQEKDVIKLSGVMARLENASSKYALIHQLSLLNTGQLDNLNEILETWTLDMAKEVLDEIRSRLQLVEELRVRIFDKKTREVQELQPLFKEGLWIFGPQFETIEFTANEGMTKVIQKLFDKEIKGTRNRPDFAILPDGSAGLYSYPRYDDDTGGEVGTDRLLIIELKNPGVRVSTKEKDQCWRYVRELYEKGLLIPRVSKVTCYVLGLEVDPLECGPTTHGDGDVRIEPLTYLTVLDRAKSRLHKLSDRVRNAPFLREKREDIDRFLSERPGPGNLFEATPVDSGSSST